MRWRVITVAGNVDAESDIAAQLDRRRDVEVILRCVDRVEVLAASQGGSIDAAIVIGVPRWMDRDVLGQTSRLGIRVLGLPASFEDGEPLRDLGCESLPLGAGATEVIEKLQAPAHGNPPPADDAPPAGKLVAVWGPKGAPGRTRVAIELAYLAGRSGVSTALIDGDVHGGDVTQLLDISSDTPGLPYLSRHVDELPGPGDHVTWGTVVPGVIDPSQGHDVNPRDWERLLAHIRRSHRLSICDVGFDLGLARAVDVGDGIDERCEIARAALREADQVVAVFRGDPVGVKHLLWGSAELRSLCDPERTILVANQVAPGDERAVSDALRRHLGRSPDALVPVRHERVLDAIRRGRPVSEGGSSSLTRALEPVAEKLGVHVPARGLLARLGGRT